MKLSIERSVCVITPTIGSPTLKDAVLSVFKQTYKNLRHLIVIDGEEHEQKVYDILSSLPPTYREDVDITVTPNNTGANGFYGHRIYAAYPFLLNEDYILFLDEDNWYEPNHVETLVNLFDQKNLDFSFSFRKIFDKDGKYICDDNCESLGLWPIWLSNAPGHGEEYLIDTSSFCFKRDWLVKCSHFWNSGWGADRNFLNNVRDFARYDTSKEYSLCYRLDGNPTSVTEEFFKRGNLAQSNFYGGKFPWH